MKTPNQRTPMTRILRINRLLSERGFASRRGSEVAILQGRVRVKGEIVRELSAKFSDDVEISVDGKPLEKTKKYLYLFHKPRNVITTMSDPQGRPCVSDYCSKLPVRVFPVGRLDFDVSGLLLLTNDGELAERLLHPRYEIEREYLARVSGLVDAAECRKITKGFKSSEIKYCAYRCNLQQENQRTLSLIGPKKQGETLLSLVVREGRNHFVKQLLELAGFPVLSLARIRFGPYSLGRLRPGEIIFRSAAHSCNYMD